MPRPRDSASSRSRTPDRLRSGAIRVGQGGKLLVEDVVLVDADEPLLRRRMHRERRRIRRVHQEERLDARIGQLVDLLVAVLPGVMPVKPSGFARSRPS
jgi:hypothetical protein